LIEPCVTTLVNVAKLDFEENMFNMGASIEESFQAPIIRELFFFRKFSILSSTCVIETITKLFWILLKLVLL